MDDYEKQAEQFLKKTNTKMQTQFLGNILYFEDDKEKRDVYLITLERGTRKYAFRFGQSMIASGQWIVYRNGKEMFNGKRPNISNYQVKKNKDFKEPTAYDVLASLTKYDVGEFKDFCADFGYSDDSIKARKIYDNVKKEYSELCKIFNSEEMEELSEIN